MGASKGTRFTLILKYLFFSLSFSSYAWQGVSNGIEYQEIPIKLSPWSHLHVFRIDLSQNQLALVSAKKLGFKQAFVSELAKEARAKLAVNGGFFDETFRPLGLRLHEAEHNPLKKVSWWGVFYIQNNQAYIKRTSHFTPDKSIEFAIQGGPRLLVNGKKLSLKPGRDERTALGITKDGKVIILVTENAPLTTRELADIMASDPIHASYALNLDGGSSTQLYTNMPALHLDLHGFAMVVDAIVVKEKPMMPYPLSRNTIRPLVRS